MLHLSLELPPSRPLPTADSTSTDIWSTLPRAVYQLLPPQHHGSVERAHPAIGCTLTMMVNEQRADWDKQLFHGEVARKTPSTPLAELPPTEGCMSPTPLGWLLTTPTYRGR